MTELVHTFPATLGEISKLAALPMRLQQDLKRGKKQNARGLEYERKVPERQSDAEGSCNFCAFEEM